MTNYRRVLPRDLFNEANLLKNYARLWILLNESNQIIGQILEHSADTFDIQQNESSGGLTIANLTFVVKGETYVLERPLNSREEWSLMVSSCHSRIDFEEISVFDDSGNFSNEMRKLLEMKD